MTRADAEILALAIDEMDQTPNSATKARVRARAATLDTPNTARAALRRAPSYDVELSTPLRAAIAEAGAEDIAASADVDSVAAAKAQALTLIDKAEARAETARSRVRANEMVSEPSIEKAEAWEALASAIADRDAAKAEAHALVDKAEAAAATASVDQLRQENAILAERVAVAEARASQAEARAAVAEAQAEALQRQVRAGVSRVWELVEADAVREMGEKWRERDTVASHADEPPHSVTAVDAFALRASIKGFDEALASWRGEIARVQLRGSEPGSAVGVCGLGEQGSL